MGQVGLLPFKNPYLIEEYDKLPNFFKVFLVMAQRMRALMEKVAILAGDPKIFNPFYTTKEEGKGTDLSMYIVKQMLELHKSYIQLDSEIGVGTTVTIGLPLARGSL